MQLIKQMIEKKLTLSEEFSLRGFFTRSVWNFFASLQLALATSEQNFSSSEIIQRNKLWATLINGSLNEQQRQRLSKNMNNDRMIIIQGIHKCKEINENSSDISNSIWKPGMIGILSYDYPVMDIE